MCVFLSDRLGSHLNHHPANILELVQAFFNPKKLKIERNANNSPSLLLRLIDYGRSLFAPRNPNP